MIASSLKIKNALAILFGGEAGNKTTGTSALNIASMRMLFVDAKRRIGVLHRIERA